MRRAVLVTGLVATLFARVVAAECLPPEGCVDAEPLWLVPAPTRFLTISDPETLKAGALAATGTLGFRLRPAVFTVPSPNRDGRDVNVISHATDISLGARWGVGHRLELTLVAPAGLYQRGAGIKGVTSQSAEPIAPQSLHDPRVGFGFELPQPTPAISAKLRFEAKLPIGSSSASATEAGPVASPSLALMARHGGWFAATEVGLRLRRPSELFGLRVGSQVALGLGVGYALREPRLTFTLESYALPSLIASKPGRDASLPGEWLLAASFSPRALRSTTFGAGGGGGLPLSSDAAGTRLAYGVPTLRGVVFVRLATD